MKPKLSICIPTYNRAEFLGEAIESIVRQAPPALEIAISDNASTDGTEDLVRGWQSRFDRLVYHRCRENAGADRNYLNVVDIAQGEYCWLMGSDDALAPDAIQSIWPLLEREPDVIIADRKHVRRELRRSLGDESALTAQDGATFECSSPGELVRYLSSARGFLALFPYLSNLIVRRSSWQAQPSVEQFIGTAWVHSAKILGMLKAGGRLIYARRPVVLNRRGNDSFLSLGHARRALLDVNYLHVARHFLQSDEQSMQLMTRILYRHCFNLINLMSMRRHCFHDDPESVRLLEEGFKRTFSDQSGYWHKMLLWRAASPWLLNALHRRKALILKLWPAH